MKEVTPKEIEELYITEEKEKVEKLIACSIPIINTHLKDHYKEIVKWGKTDITIEDLHSPHIPSDYPVWNKVLVYLRQFFKSWKIEVFFRNNGMAYEFRPIQSINGTFQLDINKLTGEKEVKSDDIIDNRADILDLE